MSYNVVIIGAVAAGPKAACRLKRLRPDASVTLVDRDPIISYGGCGIPYFISGDVSEAAELRSTSFHMVRDEKFFRDAKDVTVLAHTEALRIDREAKIVRVRNLATGAEQDLPYDKLMLATGSRPRRLPIPGADLPGVFTVSNLGEAVRLKAEIAAGKIGRAVVVGGGAIGLEMVEALTDLWGVETALVEVRDQLLPGVVGPTLARMVQTHLAEHEVPEVHLAEKVLRFEGDGRVERVVTDKRTIEADLVVMAVGVEPDSDLGKASGLRLRPGHALCVDDEFRTSDPDIYAGGDCIENVHLIGVRPVHFASGALANRQGRIIGSNLAGEHETFDGVVGTFILKCFDLAVAAAGLSLDKARAEGFDAISAFVVQGDRAHFYPGMAMMYLELVVERPTGRVLGVQGLAANGDALSARINPVAALLKFRPHVKDIANLELAYAPPYSSAVDVLHALGAAAENILAGANRPIEVAEFADLLDQGSSAGFVCLDVRGPANAAPFLKKYPDVWLNIPQEELLRRQQEVPRDKDIVLVCNSGARSYEAQVTLDHLELTRTRNLSGGIGAFKKFGGLSAEEPDAEEID